jgi:hypothetical protein
MLPILTNYLFVATLGLILLLGLLSALRPFIWWLLGIDRRIWLMEEIVRNTQQPKRQS